MQMQLFSRIHWKGTSANAGPHYQKLYARVTHIWGNRRGQPSPSAMKGPHPERTASMITFFGGDHKDPLKGKYGLGQWPRAENPWDTHQLTCAPGPKTLLLSGMREEHVTTLATGVNVLLSFFVYSHNLNGVLCCCWWCRDGCSCSCGVVIRYLDQGVHR